MPGAYLGLEALHPHMVGSGQWEARGGAIRLKLAASGEGRYSNAQLMDYHGLPRDEFPWRPPVTLAVRARFSHGQEALRGTAGFGWWNDPFVGGRATQVAVGPRVAWFFFGSAPSALGARDGWSGNGFFAQAMSVPPLPGWLTRLAMWMLKVPGVGRVADAATGPVTGAAEQPLHQIDLAAWHEYRIVWERSGVTFVVDGEGVLQCPSSPRAPLGLVIWIDNQWATIAGEGGVLAVPESQWLDLEALQVTSHAA